METSLQNQSSGVTKSRHFFQAKKSKTENPEKFRFYSYQQSPLFWNDV